MGIFFTSDTHFNHAKLLDLSDRPFETIEEMDETLVKNWNATVGRGDIIYHLGDFFFGNASDQPKVEKLLRRLNGSKQLIIGNHDGKAVTRAKGWNWVGHLKSISVDVVGQDEHQRIILCHYAMRTWQAQHHGSWQLHGHSHGSLPDAPGVPQFDVGVDVWNWKPLSLAGVIQYMEGRHAPPPDRGLRGLPSRESNMKR